MPVSNDAGLRLLVLSPREPFPPHGGWQVVIHNDIRELASKGCSVTVLALCHQQDVSSGDLEGRVQIEYFPLDRRPRWKELLANVSSKKPFSVDRYMHPELLRRACDIIRGGTIDVVLIEDVVMAQYGSFLGARVPVFVRGHNVNTIMTRRFADHCRNPLIRWAARWQSKKFFHHEQQMLNQCDAWSLITQADITWALGLWPDLAATRHDMITAGVDLDYFTGDDTQRDANLIMHVGGLEPTMNQPGMVWFCRECMPHILQKVPHARLELVGRVKGKGLELGRYDFLKTVGYVQDVRPALRRGAVFVAPQFVGSGIKLKLLHAMAMQNAIVTTSVGAEGIGARDGREMYIRDTVDSFADAVVRCLQDQEHRRELGARARQKIVSEYSNDVVGTRLLGCLEKLARSRSTDR